MIEAAVMNKLVATAAVLARISSPERGERIYHGRVPQGVTIDGGTIVVKKVGRSRDYGVVDEAESKFTTLQIDCYDLTPAKADSLANLVAAAISGAAAIGLTVTDGDNAHLIESSLIANERTQFEKPNGAGDDWRPRDSRDYRIHHT
jgi:hypothetical protein